MSKGWIINIIRQFAQKLIYSFCCANQFELSKNIDIKGNVFKGKIEDYSSAIYYLMPEAEITLKSVINERTFLIDKPKYFSDKLEINNNNIINTSILASENEMKIKCKRLASEEIGIIYSSNGNISIDADDIEFNGIIYAPNGKVTIKSNKGKINGCIIADKVKIKSSKLQVMPNKESENLLSFISSYKNDGYMQMA